MDNEQDHPIKQDEEQERQRRFNSKRAVAFRLRRAARLHKEMVAEMEAIMEGREPDTNHFK